MNTKVRILFTILLAAAFLSAAGYFLRWQRNQDVSQVSLATDRREYSTRDTMQITIRNVGEHSIDLYCPYLCNLGNVPTTFERWSNGEWQQLTVLCPFEPLLGMGHKQGTYVRHTLLPKSSLAVKIDRLENLDIQREERLRIVYYLEMDKVPIYSNEFTVKP